MIADPKTSPGFHLEVCVQPEVRSTIDDFNVAATRAQKSSLRLQSVANATQNDARQARACVAERKRTRQSSYPPVAALPAVKTSPSADTKVRCD